MPFIGNLNAIGARRRGVSKPAAPQNLAASVVDEVSIALTWNAVTGADSYKIYYGTDGVTFASSTTSATNSKTIEGLTADTTYYFYVVAIKGTTEGNASATVNAKTYSRVLYVNTEIGDNANDGLSDLTPIKDVQYAARIVSENEQINICASKTNPVRGGLIVDTDGAEGSPINIKSSSTANKAYITTLVNVSHGQEIDNLIINGDLDAWVTDAPWGFVRTYNDLYTISKESSIVHSGNAVKIVRNGSFPEITTSAYLAKNTSYTISFWHREEHATDVISFTIRTNAPGSRYYLQDDGSTWTTTNNVMPITNANGVYSQYSLTFTTAYTGLHYFAWMVATSITAYIDDIILIPTATTYEWSDVVDKNYKTLNVPQGVSTNIFTKCLNTEWSILGLDALQMVSMAASIEDCDATENTWWFDADRVLYFHPANTEQITNLHIEINQNNYDSKLNNNGVWLRGDYGIYDNLKCVGSYTNFLTQGIANTFNNCISFLSLGVGMYSALGSSIFNYCEASFALEGFMVQSSTATLNYCVAHDIVDDGFQAVGGGTLIGNYCKAYNIGSEELYDNTGFSSESEDNTSVIQLFNCVAYLCYGRGIHIQSTASNQKVKNCIAYMNGLISGAEDMGVTHGLSVDLDASNNCYGSYTNWPRIDSIEGDPLFMDAENFDFSLQAESPCINAGIDVGLHKDLAGNVIIGLPDIGCYEYQP